MSCKWSGPVNAVGGALLCWVLGLLIACSESTDPGVTIAVTGTVRDASGDQVAGARVAIEYTFDSVAYSPFVGRRDAPNGGVPIVFDLKESTDWILEITDYGGEHVKTVSGHDNGLLTVMWDGADENGRPLPDGMYYYRIEAGGSSVTKKLLLADGCFGMRVGDAYLELTDSRGVYGIDWDIVPFGESTELMDEYANIRDTAWVANTISVCAWKGGTGSSVEAVLQGSRMITVDITIPEALVPDPR